MKLFVLNKNFEIVGVMDSYYSIEWVRRYYNTGDFVLKTIANSETVELLKEDNYIVREDDEMIVQIEKKNISTNSESGNDITVSGRSVEKVLGQRIIWTQTNSRAGETAEAFIRRLVEENAINTAEPERKIPNLKLGELKGFQEKIDKQITGDNLLTAVTEICQAYEYGFKIIMNTEGNLEFELYKGTDRSYKQNENPYVIFSDSFDNIINTTYEYDKENFANVALVGGEGEGKERKYQTIGAGSGYGRYEIFVDAKDLSTNDGEITLSDYNKMLQERGKEKISEKALTESYEGELETTKTYIYKEDYNVGDIVQVENEFEIRANPRIIEMIESHNENGYKAVPTFGTWEV